MLEGVGMLSEMGDPSEFYIDIDGIERFSVRDRPFIFKIDDAYNIPRFRCRYSVHSIADNC